MYLQIVAYAHADHWAYAKVLTPHALVQLEISRCPQALADKGVGILQLYMILIWLEPMGLSRQDDFVLILHYSFGK